MRRARRAGPVDGGDHVYHLFVVRTDERDALRAHLERSGVASAVHYPFPIHRTEAYAQLGYEPGSLPVAESLAEQICSLPLFPGHVRRRGSRRSSQAVGVLRSHVESPTA